MKLTGRRRRQGSTRSDVRLKRAVELRDKRDGALIGRRGLEKLRTEMELEEQDLVVAERALKRLAGLPTAEAPRIQSPEDVVEAAT